MDERNRIKKTLSVAEIYVGQKEHTFLFILCKDRKQNKETKRMKIEWMRAHQYLGKGNERVYWKEAKGEINYSRTSPWNR